MIHPKKLFRRGLLPATLLVLGMVFLAGCGRLGLRDFPLTDTVWQWVSVAETSTHAATEVPNPENYTIILREDGTFSGMADCNVIGGTYTNPEEGVIDFQLGVSTLAFCGEGSLDQQFLALLDGVVAGSPDEEGGLGLETAGGAQRMTFQNGGSAPAP
jgi:heat shock protein HslJ